MANAIPESIHDKVLKLKALADGKANEHESKLALEKLVALLKKHNLTLADLKETEAKEWVEFTYSTLMEKELLFQLYGRLVKNERVSYKHRQRSIWFNLTRVQQADMELYYSHHRKAMKKAYKEWVSAYYLANDLLAQPTGKQKDPTPEEIEAWRRIMEQAKGVKVAPVLKGLPSGVVK